MTEPRQDLTRTILAVLFTGGLIVASLWILQPFVASGIWATMIVIATWPLMLRVQARLWNKRGLAAAVMTLAVLLILIVPLLVAITAIVSNSDQIAAWFRYAIAFQLPPPPDWVAGLPLVGTKLAELWQEAVGSGLKDLAVRAEPYAGTVTGWFAAHAGTFAQLVAHLFLLVVISGVLYASGDRAAAGVVSFGRRLAGERGEHVMRLAAQAIRGVAMGVVVTALVQSVLGGIGLAVTGVPFALLLTSIMFMFCIAQIGPIPVLLCAAGWLYWNGDHVWGTVLLVWTVVVGSIDNFLRPVLIKRGADLPMLLIFAGVIGGLLSLGLIGIFVGPVVLAVSYTLLESWVMGGKDSVAPTVSPDHRKR